MAKRAAIFGRDYWAELERLRLVARRVYAARPWRPRKVGSGVEVSDKRPYSVGDEPRYIDWRYYARARRLFTKLYESERDIAYLVLIDTSASMGVRWREALRLCHACVYLATCAGDRGCAASLCSRGVDILADCRTPPAARIATEPLQKLKPENAVNLPHALSAALSLISNVHIVLLVTDLWDERWRDVFRTLSLARVRSVVVVLHSGIDRGAVVEGELRLVDAETGEHLLLAADRGVVSDYEKEYGRWRDEVEEMSRRSGCETFFCRAEEGFSAGVERLFAAGILLP
ncbi:MAG: hypothetical protein DRP63_02595 [Planctomycetota bacterium]|nr:MAG: hypothetical protein DRP63_02595 [Planctomycetota bacterium]